MGCPGCQQSHAGPGQSPAGALRLHHATVAEAHQLHSQQPEGWGCCYHTVLTVLPAQMARCPFPAGCVWFSAYLGPLAQEPTASTTLHSALVHSFLVTRFYLM